MLPEALLPCSIQGNVVLPHFLGEHDHAWLRVLLEEYARFVGRENQQACVTMTVEQHAKHLALGLREADELACAAESVERTPPFDGPSRRPREILPARAGCHAPELRMHGTERRHPALVRLPLGSRQVEVQGDDVEAGEEGTGEVTDRELVGGRANELD